MGDSGAGPTITGRPSVRARGGAAGAAVTNKGAARASAEPKPEAEAKVGAQAEAGVEAKAAEAAKDGAPEPVEAEAGAGASSSPTLGPSGRQLSPALVRRRPPLVEMSDEEFFREMKRRPVEEGRGMM